MMDGFHVILKFAAVAVMFGGLVLGGSVLFLGVQMWKAVP
jgi:hypothetical protein